MKTIPIESTIGLDRRATLNEVLYAMSLWPQSTFALVVACDDPREMGSAFSDRACNLPEDIAWVELAGEIPDSKSN